MSSSFSKATRVCASGVRWLWYGLTRKTRTLCAPRTAPVLERVTRTSKRPGLPTLCVTRLSETLTCLGGGARVRVTARGRGRGHPNPNPYPYPYP